MKIVKPLTTRLMKAYKTRLRRSISKMGTPKPKPSENLHGRLSFLDPHTGINGHQKKGVMPRINPSIADIPEMNIETT